MYFQHVSESVTAHLERNILDKRQKMPDNYKENTSENHPITEKAPGVDVEALCTFFEVPYKARITSDIFFNLLFMQVWPKFPNYFPSHDYAYGRESRGF